MRNEEPKDEDIMNNHIEFELEGSEYIELKNLLKVSGLCDTGGAAKVAIEQGEVLVDGVVDTRKGLKVRANQVVSYKGKSIKVLGSKNIREDLL